MTKFLGNRKLARLYTPDPNLNQAFNGFACGIVIYGSGKLSHGLSQTLEKTMFVKPFSGILLSMLIGLLAVPLASFDARAEFISTQEALAIEKIDATARLDAWLMRADVAAELAEMGVDPEMARLRAASLSPAELNDLVDRLDELPAGAGALEVLGVVLVVIIVLELLGVTNIFGRR